MRKFQLIAKQFDKEALYLWIQDNLKDMRRFAYLQEDVLYRFCGFDDYQHYSCYDPAFEIYSGNKQEIRETIQELRNYSKKVKEFEVLRRKIF